MATGGPLGKGASVGRTICIATSSLPQATLRQATAGAPAPVLGLARPAAQLPQPCHGLRPLGAAATRPARVFPERLGTLETRGGDAGGGGGAQNTNGGGATKYNLSNQSLVASQCLVDKGGWLTNVYLGNPGAWPWWVLSKCLLGQVIGRNLETGGLREKKFFKVSLCSPC